MIGDVIIGVGCFIGPNASLRGDFGRIIVEEGANVQDCCVHEKAESLPKLVAALLEQSSDLAASKRARVEGAVKQVARVADALHAAADRGDAARTRKELARLDVMLELIRAQYPAGSLDTGMHARH